MRYLAILIAILATPLFARQLSDTAVLAKLDDATASEVRWILETDFFTENGSGIAPTPNRSSIAYKRLLEAGSVDTFDLLVKAESVPAICYGICGVAELGPSRLDDLLPLLVTDDRVIAASETDIMGSTTPADKLMEKIAAQVRYHERAYDAAKIQQAWRTWLENIGRGNLNGPHLIRKFEELLGELPDADTELEVHALEYLRMYAADEGWVPMRSYCHEEATSVVRDLCIQSLYAEEAPLIESIWSRTLDDKDVLNLEITASFWTRAAREWSDIDCEDREGFFESEFWQLTQRDWHWLATHEEGRVRDAAHVLRRNPIAGWRADEPAPEGDPRPTWLMSCLYASGGEVSPSPRRARLTLLKALGEDINDLPLDVDSPWRFTVARKLVEYFQIQDLLPVAIDAIHTESPRAQAAGVTLLFAMTERGSFAESLRNTSVEWGEVFSRLWEIGEAGEGRRFWETRFLSMLFIERFDSRQLPMREEHRARVAEWHRQLAFTLVESPRLVPVSLELIRQADEELFVEDYDDDPARSIIINIYEGDYEFVVYDELPERPKEEWDETPAMLYERMKNALAKLEQ